jgi:hypothetical protein
MNFFEGGQEFADLPIALQKALRSWEDSIRLFNANFYRLREAMQLGSPYQAELLDLLEHSITHLEFLAEAIHPELRDKTQDELIEEIGAHTVVLQMHNQRVASLLSRIGE